MQEVGAGVLMAVVGLSLVLFPEKIFILTEKWKFRDTKAEISETYKGLLRVLGIVFTVAGMAVAASGLR